MDVNGDDRALRELYARWLDWASKAGFAILAVAFVAYVSGVLPSYLAPAELPRYWSLPVDRFIAATGAQAGWAWLGMLAYGDALNLAAVALLALVTPACYARLVPALFVRRERLLLALASLQLAILCLAASGILS